MIKSVLAAQSIDYLQNYTKLAQVNSGVYSGMLLAYFSA